MIVILFINVILITVKNIMWKEKSETITMLPIMKKCKIYPSYRSHRSHRRKGTRRF